MVDTGCTHFGMLHWRSRDQQGQGICVRPFSKLINDAVTPATFLRHLQEHQ